MKVWLLISFHYLWLAELTCISGTVVEVGRFCAPTDNLGDSEGGTQAECYESCKKNAACTHFAYKVAYSGWVNLEAVCALYSACPVKLSDPRATVYKMNYTNLIRTWRRPQLNNLPYFLLLINNCFTFQKSHCFHLTFTIFWSIHYRTTTHQLRLCHSLFIYYICSNIFSLLINPFVSTPTV